MTTTPTVPDVLADLLHGVPAEAAHRLTGPDPLAWMDHAAKAPRLHPPGPPRRCRALRRRPDR